MARHTRTETKSYATSDVFAAACAAHRVNGEYVKNHIFDEEGKIVKTANKYLIHNFIDGTFDITDADRELAESVIRYGKGLSFKILKGKILNDFEQSVVRVCETEVINKKYDISLISSIPMMYFRNLARQDVESRLYTTDRLTDNVGDKVNFTAEVVRCFYSHTWGIYFVTAITTDNKQIFFSQQGKIEINTIVKGRGKVKCHYDNSTQLNYVRLS